MPRKKKKPKGKVNKSGNKRGMTTASRKQCRKNCKPHDFKPGEGGRPLGSSIEEIARRCVERWLREGGEDRVVEMLGRASDRGSTADQACIVSIFRLAERAASKDKPDDFSNITPDRLDATIYLTSPASVVRLLRQASDLRDHADADGVLDNQAKRRLARVASNPQDGKPSVEWTDAFDGEPLPEPEGHDDKVAARESKAVEARHVMPETRRAQEDIVAENAAEQLKTGETPVPKEEPEDSDEHWVSTRVSTRDFLGLE